MTSWVLNVALPSTLLLCVMLFSFHFPWMCNNVLISWSVSIFNGFEGSHSLLDPSLKVYSQKRSRREEGNILPDTKWCWDWRESRTGLFTLRRGTKVHSEWIKGLDGSFRTIKYSKEHRPNIPMLVSMLSSGIWLHQQRKRAKSTGIHGTSIFTAKGAITKKILLNNRLFAHHTSDKGLLSKIYL